MARVTNPEQVAAYQQSISELMLLVNNPAAEPLDELQALSQIERLLGDLGQPLPPELQTRFDRLRNIVLPSTTTAAEAIAKIQGIEAVIPEYKPFILPSLPASNELRLPRTAGEAAYYVKNLGVQIPTDAEGKAVLDPAQTSGVLFKTSSNSWSIIKGQDIITTLPTTNYPIDIIANNKPVIDQDGNTLIKPNNKYVLGPILTPNPILTPGNNGIPVNPSQPGVITALNIPSVISGNISLIAVGVIAVGVIIFILLGFRGKEKEK